MYSAIRLVALFVACTFAFNVQAAYNSCTVTFVAGTFPNPEGAIAAHAAARYPWQDSVRYCSGHESVSPSGPGTWQIVANCVWTVDGTSDRDTNDGIVSCAGQCTAGESFTGTYADGSSPTVCDAGCEIGRPAGGGIDVCIGGTCYGEFEETGNACDPSTGAAAGQAPDGCSVQNDTIVCDCLANPSAPFCPGGDDNNNCTDNGDGTVSCGEDGPPGGGGGGGGDDDGGSDNGVPDGPPNTGGGGDTDTDGDGVPDNGGENDNPNEDGDGQEQSCDPATQNCAGEGSASTSGSCAAQPTCSGDAIQCAILIQSWKNRCSLEDLKGNKPPWVDDPDYGRDLYDEAIEIDLAQDLDATGFAAGTCPPNPTVDLFGSTIEFPWHHICDFAGFIRPFVIMMAMFTAVGILSRGFA